MSEVKYVIFQQPDGKEYSITFPVWGTHAIMASRHVRSENDVVAAAGFASWDDEEGIWQCWGKSITLDIGSRVEDDSIINSEANEQVE